MPWYGSGTLTVAANGTNATGLGTQFLGNVRVGDGITIQGSQSLHEVIGIASNAQLPRTRHRIIFVSVIQEFTTSLRPVRSRGVRRLGRQDIHLGLQGCVPLRLFKATSESPNVFGVTPTMAVGSFSSFIPCVTVDTLSIAIVIDAESVDFRLSGSTLETRTLSHAWSMDSEPPAATYRDVYAHPHHPIYSNAPVSSYYHRDLFLVETAHLPIPYG